LFTSQLLSISATILDLFRSKIAPSEVSILDPIFWLVLVAEIARARRRILDSGDALFCCDCGWKSNPKIEPGKATFLDRFCGALEADFASVFYSLKRALAQPAIAA